MTDGSIDAPPPCAAPSTFGSAQSFPIGATGVGLAIGKLDAGATLDVAIATGSAVVILHGDGAGGFGSPTVIDTAAIGVLAESFNLGDARDDLVMWSSSAVVTRLQDDDNPGSFLAEQAFPGTFDNVTNALTDTFDPNPDVVVEDDAGGLTLYTSLQGTPGTFSNESSIGGAADQVVATGDVDGGGRDVLIVDTAGTVKLSHATGATLGAPTTIASGATGRAAVFAEVSGDTDRDVVFATAAGGTLLVNDGAGNLVEQPGTIPGVVGDTLFAADVNGDGLDDLVVPGAVVLQCPGTPAVFTQVEPLDASGPAAVVDVSGDGKPDLLRVVGSDLVVRLQ